MADPRLRRHRPADFDVNALLEILKADPKETKGQQVNCLSTKAVILFQRRELKEAIKVLGEAIALSPDDYPRDRLLLAKILAQRGELDRAEKIFRELYEYNSDDREFVDQYRGLLLQRKKWDDLKRIEERLDQLDEIFRPRP